MSRIRIAEARTAARTISRDFESKLDRCAVTLRLRITYAASPTFHSSMSYTL